MRRRFQIVDVFSPSPFAGNPVAVVLDAEGLSSDDMQGITRWMNLSETTFVLPPTSAEADYRLRIFTLERELPFAGHPTLGSCRAWLDAGNTPATEARVVQQCEAGLISVRHVGDQLAFAAPPLLREGPVDEETAREVVRFLRIEAREVVDMAWIDNGPGWLGVLLESAERVLSVEPAAAHPKRIDVGLVGPAPDEADHDYELRALFSDHTGTVREDPVTGSLNASVAQWLLSNDRARSPFRARQGRAVGRDGRIAIEREDGEIWIAGNTRVLVDGQIDA